MPVDVEEDDGKDGGTMAEKLVPCERVRLVEEFEDYFFFSVSPVVVDDNNVRDEHILYDIEALKDDHTFKGIVTRGFLRELLTVPHDENCYFCTHYGE